jgi:hypothetical protein
MITSLARIAWPGRSVKSRTMPLRLLSSAITATRSAIGVAPLASASVGTGVFSAMT